MQTIELKDLTVGYAKHKVVSHINASLNKGEITCLLGNNGTGKSTLLRTIIGFQPALCGEVLIEGIALKWWNNKELAKKISVVLTEKLSINHLTVTELVSLGRLPYTNFWGSLQKKDNQIIAHAIELVGIEHLKHRKTHTLSDGERQKVMIAKALAQQTPIIVLDEPLAFLDFQSKAETLYLLARLAHKEHKTIFLSIHDIELALQIADKIWLIDEQQHLQTNSVNKLLESKIWTKFIESKNTLFDKETHKIKIKQ